MRARSIARRNARRGVAEPAGRAQRPTETDEEVGARLPAADVVGVDELERAFVRRDRVLVRELRVEAVGRALAVQDCLQRVARGRGLGEVVRALGEEARVPFAVQLFDRFADAPVQPDAAQRREAVDQRLAHQLVREPEVAEAVVRFVDDAGHPRGLDEVERAILVDAAHVRDERDVELRGPRSRPR